MEQLLHFVWKHKFHPLTGLKTTTGEPVEVIDPGLHNHDAGPDFFNAKLKIGEVLWVGNVEVHEKSSMWYTHGHDQNPAFSNVILHVVAEADTSVYRYGSQDEIPQLVLACPDEVRRKYALLKRTDAYPACYAILRDIPPITIHSWLAAMQAERFDQKAKLIRERLKLCEWNWEHAFFITLARNFGFGLNGDVFETWAKRINLSAVGKHRDNLQQIEAIFFGMAGLLEDSLNDPYYLFLQKEYNYLAQKFTFSVPVQQGLWKLLRIRPQSFPHNKIAQLAMLYHQKEALFSQIIEAKSIKEVKLLLQTHTSSYWDAHYVFDKETISQRKYLGDSALNLLVINTVVPFLFAYGQHKSQDDLCYRAADFLESLKPENNYITRQWEQFGIHADNAADSQALIQLRKEYCDKRDCLRCRLGYEYLRGRK